MGICISKENTSSDAKLLARISRLPIRRSARKKISAIASNSAGTRLFLRQELVGDAGAIAIGEALCTNDTLKHLHLNRNHISDAGAVAIAKGLTNNATLQTLNLLGNQISDAGAVAIAKGLTTNAALQTLTLHGNKISDAGAVAIAEGLNTNATLQALIISGNPITHIGVLVLAKAFRWTENLQKLEAEPKGFPFEIVETGKEIGKGEFGSVHLGTAKGKDVVVKKSHTTSTREENFETLILLGLPEHQNVVRLLFVDRKSALILEAHKGGSLKNFARNHEDGVSLSAFLCYSHDMCAAIEQLHKHGIIHRDIALRNYVLTEDLLRAILIDFGLSWPIEEEKSVAIHPGEKMPFHQCAPEVLSELQYSKSSDIWQLGLSMWQLLHRGRGPFFAFVNGQALVQYLHKKMVEEKRCVPLTFRKNGATQRMMDTVKEVVVFCCKYDPAERPTATQLVEKVESLRESVEVQSDGSVEVHADEEKEVVKYVPNQSDVESGLNAYNYTDYGRLKTGGRSDYIDLNKDLEEHQYDKLEKFPEVDVELDEEDFEEQYQELEALPASE